MKRWMLSATAVAPEDLYLEEADVPEPGPGQVRLRVRAVALNARDQMILRGHLGRLPDLDVVPLSDVAGIVEALGEGVTGWSVGDRVTTAHVPQWSDGAPVQFGIGPGSMAEPGVAAELVVVDAAALVSSPANLDDAEASTLQVAGVTAWNALFGANPVAAGDKVLVLGSGGVALFAAQMALARGAVVYAAVRSEVHQRQWDELGIAGVVTTHEPGWGQRVHDLCGGVTKVVNSVGPGILNECLTALDGGGEVAVLGLSDFTPSVLDAMTLIGAQGSIRGVAVGSLRMHRDLAAFVAEHDIHPVVDAILDFEDLPLGFHKQADPSVFGKVVIVA